MTHSRPKPFDISLLRLNAETDVYLRALECLRNSSSASLSWKWTRGALQAAASVQDPDGSRYSSVVEWDGSSFVGECSCGRMSARFCPHQLAVGLLVLKRSPWTQDDPLRELGASLHAAANLSWQSLLEPISPGRLDDVFLVAAGEQRFVYRVELRSRPGELVGQLRIKLSRARVGRRGVGQETPYPISRLKGTSLDGLPQTEQTLLGWLLPLQGWNITRVSGFGADPRYLDVPPALVDATVRMLTRIPLAFLGDDGETPLRLAPEPLLFSFDVEPSKQGGIRLCGRLTDPPSTLPAPDLESGGHAGASELGRPLEVFPELLVGEAPCYALVDGILRQIQNLDTSSLYVNSRSDSFAVSHREMTLFLERYSPALLRQGLMTEPELSAALPEVVGNLPPHPLLTLEEVDGSLVAWLSFRYGPSWVVSATRPRAIEEFEQGAHRTLLQRDLTAESTLEARLQGLGAHSSALGKFEWPREGAIRFLAEALPVLLSEGWSIEGEQRIERCKPSRTPVKVRGAIVSGVDWFELSLVVTHGEEEMPLAELFQAWRSGRRFIRFGNGELALMPEEWLQRNKSLLQALLGERSQRQGASSADADDEVLDWAPSEANPTRLSPWHLPLVSDLEDPAVALAMSEGLRVLLHKLKTFDGIKPITPPQGLNVQLRDYQIDGVSWLAFLREYGLAGILADDMGLGKTLQAICLLLLERQRLGECRPSLVIAPTSVLFNWEAECKRFAPSLHAVVLHGPDRYLSTEKLEAHELIITSYALLRRDLAFHQSIQYHYVILDEAQSIKNPESLTALAVRSLACNHRLTLTGTPIENRLTELWSQFAFLMPGLLPDLRGFLQEFVLPIERDREPLALERLRRQIRPFVLRRLKEEVARELPPRTDSVLYCELEGPQRTLYDAVLKSARERVKRAFEERGGQARITALDALLKLRQICCHPKLVHLPEALGVDVSAKLDLCLETLIEVVEEGHRVLVFSQFVEMLQLIQSGLQSLKVGYEYLDGRTRDRQARIDRFNAGSAPVFLISLKAGGTGLNLASADYVIHFDPWWNPAVEDQATDRAYRIGQTRPVFSYKLIARNTVEERILILQQRKRELASSLFEQGEGIEQALTLDDFQFLFEGDE